MSPLRPLLIAPIVAVCAVLSTASAVTAGSSVGRTVADFVLPDCYGAERSLADYADAEAVVVVFLGVECPLAKLYGPRLAELADDYSDRGVAVIGIDANRQDSLTELAAYAHRYGVEFPLLKDNRADAVDAFGATRTPEAFVLGPERTIRYQGRIDDQYDVGVVRDAPQRRFLREALDAVLAGGEPADPVTRAVGCVIGRPQAPVAEASVTYSEHVAPILERHCVECHREGEIAPFVLRGYDEVAGWADTIAEVVRDQRMPPWHAAPEGRALVHTRVLTPAEKQTLYDWADAGAPEGDPAALPERREFVSGWRLPKDPDRVIPMRGEPYRVASQGVIDYQYFAVDPGFEEDVWIQAADIRPGEASVVHHVIVFISPSADRPSRGLGWLTAYVPGQAAMRLPEGRARLIPAGSKLIFQMHYTPTGAEELDKTELGLVFADPETVTEEVVSVVSANPKFEIPPGAADYRVEDTQSWFPPSGTLIGVGPHMHYRGKSFRMTGVWPDGRRELLLDVPRYDFNWQTNYRFADSIALEPGFRVEMAASFDNSAANPFNPDPTIPVRWGDQSFEEMMVAFFEVAMPRGALDSDEPRRRGATDAQRAEAQQLAREFFQRHDDGDGRLRRSELPDAFAVFAFDRYDLDDDQRITEQEVFDATLANLVRRF